MHEEEMRPNWAHLRLHAVRIVKSSSILVERRVALMLHRQAPGGIRFVFRTMTPRRVRELKVKSEKFKVMERQRRDLLNFTLYVLHFTLLN